MIYPLSRLKFFYLKAVTQRLRVLKQRKIRRFEGEEEYLQKLDVSDDFDRLSQFVSNTFSYRMSVGEVKEMIHLLSIQKTEEWESNKRDEEVKKFYESAYKEMAMKLIESQHLNQKRIVDSIALKVLVMHPYDLSTQMTPRIYGDILALSVITNVNTEDNLPRVNKLFAENNKDGRYQFSADEFRDYSLTAGNFGFKVNTLGDCVTSAVMADDGRDFNYPNFEEEILRSEDYDGGKFHQKREKEYIKGKRNGDKYAKLFGENVYYLSKHPELYSKKVFNLKNNEGGLTFGEETMNSAHILIKRDGATGYYNLMKNGKLKMLPQNEVDDYEKYMKKHNYPKLYNNAEDPYGIDLYKKKLDPIIIKQNGQPIVLENGEYKTKEGSEY